MVRPGPEATLMICFPEMRAYPRLERSYPAVLKSADPRERGPRIVTGRTLNVSSGGIFLVDLSTKELYEGDRVHLSVEVRMEEGPFPGRCLVLEGSGTATRWQEVPGAKELQWGLALRLDAPLSIEETSHPSAL